MGLSASPAELVEYNSKVFFIADESDTGKELWSCDDKDTCDIVSDINTGRFNSLPNQLTRFNGKLYFKAFTSNSYNELWSVDSAGSVSQVKDINPSGSGNPQMITVALNRLYFQANDG